MVDFIEGIGGREANERKEADGISHRSWSTFQAGLVGGFFATLVMTVFRVPTARSLPPTAEFLEQYLGGNASDYRFTSLVLHFLYGTGAGVIFGPLLGLIAGDTNEPETVGLLVGVLYGTILSVFGDQVVLRRVLGMDLDTDEEAIFHAGHLVYGLTLGSWIGSRS